MYWKQDRLSGIFASDLESSRPGGTGSARIKAMNDSASESSERPKRGDIRDEFHRRIRENDALIRQAVEDAGFTYAGPI